MGDANLSEKYLDLLKSAICASLYIESAWRFLEGPMRLISSGNVSSAQNS